MSGRRIALAALALAVVVGVALLLRGVTSSGSDGESARRVAEASGKTTIVDQAVPDTRRGVARPALAADDEGQESSPDSDDSAAARAPLEYVRDDGTRVRDHRAGGPGPALRPRPVSRPALLKMRNDIRPLVKSCGKPLRQRERTLRGKMQADLTISIRAGRVTVEALDLQVQGLEDSSFTDCVRSALEGLELDAPDDQADVSRHTLSLPFKIP